MPRICAIAAAALAPVLLAGCGVGGGGGIPVETYDNPDGVALLSIAQVTLDGAVEDGLACFWAGEDRATVIKWPEGYSAAEDPLRVLDAEGQVVAEIGDHLTLGGGFRGSESACLGEGSRVWLASE